MNQLKPIKSFVKMVEMKLHLNERKIDRSFQRVKFKLEFEMRFKPNIINTTKEKSQLYYYYIFALLSQRFS